MKHLAPWPYYLARKSKKIVYRVVLWWEWKQQERKLEIIARRVFK
jgi:hypothetical protein